MTALDDARITIDQVDTYLINSLRDCFAPRSQSRREELKAQSAALAQQAGFDAGLAEQVYDVIGDYVEEIDPEIITSLARRFNAVAHVAAYKKENNLPAVNEERRRAVIDSVEARAESMGANPLLARRLIETMVLYFEDIQEDLFTHKTGPLVGYTPV